VLAAVSHWQKVSSWIGEAMPIELHDSRSRLQYVWNGSHTVNVYDHGGNEVDCFTFGFDKEPTFEDFCAVVARRIDG
jgi:hypothetical protein